MNIAPVFQLYGEVGQASRDRVNSNSNKSSMNYYKNPRNIYLNTISDRKSYKSIQTNTTAIIDDMSFPDERSIDFKLTEFGAKNLRQVVPEETKILINKVKNTNATGNTHRIPVTQFSNNPNLKFEQAIKKNEHVPVQNKQSSFGQNQLLQKQQIKQQNMDTKRPRIKQTFRGGSVYEHVSYSPIKNTVKYNQQIFGKQNMITDHQNSKQTHNQVKVKPMKTLNNEIYGLKNKPNKKIISCKPMQINASDHSISGISKGGMSQVSIIKQPENSQIKKIAGIVFPVGSPENSKPEDFQYKTIETLEVDNIYNDNFTPLCNQNQNIAQPKQSIQKTSDRIITTQNLDQSSNLLNLEQKSKINLSKDNSASSQNGDQIFKYLEQEAIDKPVIKEFSNPISQSNISNSGMMLKEIESTRLDLVNNIPSQKQVDLSESLQSKSHGVVIKSILESNASAFADGRLPQAGYQKNQCCISLNQQPSDQLICNTNDQNQEFELKQKQINDQQPNMQIQFNESLNNSNNKQQPTIDNLNSHPLVKDQQINHEHDQLVTPQIETIKLQDQLFQNANRQSNNMTPQQFEGSSFGGSQVVHPHNQLALQQQQKELSQFNSINQLSVVSQKASTAVANNNPILENRPYVPKATVILNQDTDYDQIELDPIEHSRPYSQTVVEAPTHGVNPQKSRSSLNNSKKSYDHYHQTKPKVIESASSDQGVAQIKSNRSGNALKSQSTINSLYSRTETLQQSSQPRRKAFLKKGDGLQKRWSSRHDKLSSGHDVDSASKISDTQKPSYLYFKALKEVSCNNKLKSRKGSNNSEIEKSYKSKKEELSQRHKQLVKSKQQQIYYNTKPQRDSLSYKQKQINSIEKMKRELASARKPNDQV